MSARKIIRGLKEALDVARGKPESFGWLKIERHTDGTETWELPDGRMVRVPVDYIATKVDYLPPPRRDEI